MAAVEGHLPYSSVWTGRKADAELELLDHPQDVDKTLKSTNIGISLTEATFLSQLQAHRCRYVPPLPHVLTGQFEVTEERHSKQYDGTGAVQGRFPRLWGRPALRVLGTNAKRAQHAPPGAAVNNGQPLCLGVVLSGGQAPGGHNVILGMLDFLNCRHPGSRLYGFTNGCKGVVQCRYKELHNENLAAFRNSGGFHMIGSGRDKIESDDDLAATAACAKKLGLDGLVVIGGDDSNTNAAVIAEYFLEAGVPTSVVGVPKTIDGDLKNDHIPISFGFDTATKIYSELIGNIMIDAASARKYYHFIRLMGRSASHITLECALQTHPQVALISEEVHHKRLTLKDIAEQIADVVCTRSAGGKDYGVVLLPEGLIESVAEMEPLMAEINELLARQPHLTYLEVGDLLTPGCQGTFQRLPVSIQLELLLDRDPHGNVQVARIETEKLMIKLVEAELEHRREQGRYHGKFAGLPHYFGYEGRCGLPTNFDATYCYALGQAAGALISRGATGLMATVARLAGPAQQWAVGGAPLVDMMVMERRKGKLKPVIRKALVEMDSPAFTALQDVRDTWALQDCYRAPGPIQFEGGELADAANLTLALEVNEGKHIHIR